jgi:tRNA-dihydrouridine synthase B
MIIGNVRLKNNIFLAPMAGVTDLPFRIMCKKYGAGFVYTEMISSKALYYNDKKTLELIATDKREEPFGVQIFGNDPAIMASTAYKALGTGASILDINMGCPAPKVANNGDGSALLKDPSLIGKIVKEVVGAVNVPVTCKIRSGFDKVADVVEIAKIIEDNGASAITVHPRTRDMYYSGVADRSLIKLVKDNVKIPVIGNGDIFTPESALDMINETGCDGVMVARGAQGNPFIFTQIQELLETGSVTFKPSIDEKIDVMTEHIKMLIKQKGEYVGVREARKHIAWYIKGMRGCARMKENVCRIESAQKLLEEIQNFKDDVK